MIAKADGDVPVQAYIAVMAGWKRNVGMRLVPVVPVFTHYVKGPSSAALRCNPFGAIAHLP